MSIVSDHAVSGDGSAIGSPLVRATPIYLQIASRVREAIASGRIVPGQTLTERELAEATGASRTSVREAIRQLESEGLVAAHHGRGIEVIQLSAEQAAHVYEVRASLEATAAGLFAMRATETQIQELANQLDRLEEVRDDPHQVVEVKDAFYDCLLDGAGNPTLRQVLEGLRLRIAMLRMQSLAQAERLDRSIRELRALVAAVANRDAPRAAELASAHVAEAARAALGKDVAIFSYQSPRAASSEAEPGKADDIYE